MKNGPPDRDDAAGLTVFTVKELADLTSMSVAFWRREIRLRQIAVIGFGRALRISKADLTDYIDCRRRGRR